MLDTIASTNGFLTLMALFGLGVTGASIGNKHNRFANLWSHGLAAAGSTWGLLFASAILATGREVVGSISVSLFPFLSLSVHVDKLAALFIGIISLIALFCSLYATGYTRGFYNRYNIGALGALYNAFIAGMLMVVTASNGIWFLIAWEVMSLASYFLVAYDRDDPQNVKASYLYLVMTHVGAACILFAMMLLYGDVHSFDFATIKAHAAVLPESTKAAVFILAFIGLGTKAGIIPLHIWLPSAHPAAPSNVSALMSGVMIKTAIYMMIRLFMDILQPIPTWWGLVVLIVGAVSSLLGVLYALTEHNIKRLLAYHSIENIGIIMLGLGSAMIFASLHQTGLELLALTAALFHTLNHATFKSLLFLAAGSVIHATHTKDIEKYGGLIRLMPLTAISFLIGSMAISALPPFNGFFSEWLTYQSLFSGLSGTPDYVQWSMVLAISSLALTGGLAITCFVKVFGIAFLARPRSYKAEHAKESSVSMTTAMAGLTTLCVIIGIGAAPIASVLHSVSQAIGGDTHVSSLINTPNQHSLTLSIHNNASSASGPIIAATLIVAAVAVWAVVRFGVHRNQKVTIAPTWDCGTPLNGRMEITATSFARSITLIFRGILKPSLQHHVEYCDDESRYNPRSRTASLEFRDVYRAHLYSPVYEWLLRLSGRIKKIQNGNLNSYVLYIFLILVITLVAAI